MGVHGFFTWSQGGHSLKTGCPSLLKRENMAPNQKVKCPAGYSRGPAGLKCFVNAISFHRNLNSFLCMVNFERRDLIRQVIMQDDVQQRFMYTNTVFVFDKAKLAKAIHEKADAGSCGADDLCQGFLRDLGNQCMWLARQTEFRHDQKGPR